MTVPMKRLYRLEFDDLDRAVLRGLAAGRTNAEIGAELAFSGETIKKRLAALGAALSLADNDRAAIVAAAIRQGVIR